METINGFNLPKHCRVIGTFVKITSYAVIVKVFDMNSVTLVYYISFIGFMVELYAVPEPIINPLVSRIVKQSVMVVVI